MGTQLGFLGGSPASPLDTFLQYSTIQQSYELLKIIVVRVLNVGM